MPSRRPARSGRLWRGLVVALCTLVAGEVAARLGPVPTGAPPTSGADIRLQGNPYLLWELVPGTHVEAGVSVRINSMGLRGPEVGEKGWSRWMALGDSSVYGFGVPDDAVFTSRLAAARDVEVINAAVPGYSTFQALNQLRMRTLALDPDVFIVGNLWSDNKFDTFVDRELLASYAGWAASPMGRLRAALHRSSLFTTLDWALRVGPHAEKTRTVRFSLKTGGTMADRRRVAIADYAQNLDTICRLAEGRGLIFVALPNREDLSPREGGGAWAAYRDVMRDTAQRCGAPLVDLPRVFSQSGHPVDALFLDEMHPTALGHELMSLALTTVEPGIARDPGPFRVWTDASVPRPSGAPSWTVQLLAPPTRGGRYIVDLREGERIVATGAFFGPGEIRLDVPPGLGSFTVRVTYDPTRDGPAGDRYLESPSAINVPLLDFTGFGAL